jgi:hypothetical protein
MRAHKPKASPINLVELRGQRDREIALAFYRRDDTRGAVAEIMEAYKLPRRTVYNILDRMRDWAIKELSGEVA